MSNILKKENKSKFYKLQDGGYLLTDSFYNIDTNEEIYADKDKVLWEECIEIENDEVQDCYFEQLYLDNKNLCIDTDWGINLMPEFLIKLKQENYINNLIDAELSLESPDTVYLLQNYRQKEELNTLTKKQIYELALQNLSRAEKDTTIIKSKIEAKILECS